jgi:hypothetical protein
VDDIVGFRVLNSQRRWVGLLTYGRLWEPIDDSDLKAAVRASLPKFGLQSTDEICLCDSLQELRSCPYFYEGFLSFAWHPIPFGDDYEEWRAQMRARVLSGDSIHCVGELSD